MRNQISEFLPILAILGNSMGLVRYGGKRGMTENFGYYIITLGNVQQCTYFPKDRPITLVIHKYLAYYSSWC